MDEAVKADKKFINSMDVRLHDANLIYRAALQAESFDSILEEDFVKHIRTLCGCESKVTLGGFTYTKAAIDDMFGKFRGFQTLVKACKVFMSKRDSSTDLSISERSAMAQAFAQFKLVKGCEREALPWCFSSLDILSGYSFDVAAPVHPADVLQKETIMKTRGCTLESWAALVQDVMINLLRRC